MGKIALLVSREEMIYQAHNILQEKKHEIGEMRVIKTEDTVSEARQSIANGASIIIARGLQASLIKQYTDIPVVEIVITAQEMALLVSKAKQILKKENPVLGVVGFKNMFCDMSYFDLIYGIEMRTYFAEKGDLLEDMARQAVRDGVDLIIGGDTAVGIAGEAGIPSLFLSNTEDSMRNALSMAESVDYAMSVEKRGAAQIETLLDYSFNGVARLDACGIIVDINATMEDILEKKKEEILLKAAGEVFPELLGESFNQVLEYGKESYSLFMEINRTSVFAIVAPVVIEKKVEGAILTCHRMKRKQHKGQELKGKSSLRGAGALGEFGDLLQESKSMQDCVRLAKLYALSEKAVFITGEPGTEKQLLAQCIHNAGLHKDGPFVNISCDGLEEEAQYDLLFGDKGAAAQAKGGSLLIEDVHALTKANQYRLYQLIRHKHRMGREGQRYPGTEVRVMVTSMVSLSGLLKEGGFRKELCYLLEGLSVTIPPLKDRKEDLEFKIRETIRDCCEHYSRFHVLTNGAYQVLLHFPWKGNLIQVENFIERLILTAEKRSLDEAAVENLLARLYPGEKEEESQPASTEKEEIPFPMEAVKIKDTLFMQGGNREKTAKELGISKATLWRKMKKYHLE
ncbi:PrpR N-terminal domain-containing protein [Lacrimispora defluvii]|uniref:Sigma 54-interacting transcriptional regulator n=1 Tax=Lacrimispora defluvii TaxID=2719233 RepID=A0ABX1VKA1_9FIRM|nr:PrpR N-terminal domain-containing protein [Lacrimispora defluvii]NNJ28383.1 sigma 54-interacting transcriptional regulator [Lacrimispora defluvii]